MCTETEEKQEGTMWNIRMLIAEDRLRELEGAEQYLDLLLDMPPVIPIGVRVAEQGAVIRTLRQEAADIIGTDPIQLERD